MAKKKERFVFIRGSMPSVVWNPKEGRPLAEFCDENKRVIGYFITSDSQVAKVLRNMGYKEDKDYPDGPPHGGHEPAKAKITPDLIPSGVSPELRADILDSEGGTVIDQTTSSKRRRLKKGKGK